jgi:ABC-2 type transport system permease protein
MAKLTNLDPSLAEKLIRPISQQFEEIRPELKNIQITFPLVLATITIFVSMLFSTVVTVMELNNKAYIRDLLAPVNDWVFTVGLAITNFIVVAAQIAVLLVIGQVNFGMPVLENISELLPVICMLILIFVFIGMCFAYIARTTQSAILLSTFMSLAFFLFSDTITPLKAMLPLAAKLAEFNPLYIAHSMIREILLFGLPFNLIIGEFIALTVYAVALLVIVLVAARRRNKIRF